MVFGGGAFQDYIVRIDGLQVVDSTSAYGALSEIMNMVMDMNSGSSRAVHPEVRGSTGMDPMSGLMDRLEDWINRCSSKLAEIVEKIPGATSFSIGVGTGVTVSLTFGPLTSPPHADAHGRLGNVL
jgi:hypothetical protein